jgi:Strictosidine synthase
LTKIVERLEEGQKRLLIGPETVIVHPKTNALYAFARGAKLVRLDDLRPSASDNRVLTAKVTVSANLGIGAPLSGKFTEDGKTLYVVDPILGLVRIRNFQDNQHLATIELVANKVMDNGKLTKILYADDVAIGPKTGKIYFSDGTWVNCMRCVSLLYFCLLLVSHNTYHHFSATDIPPDRLFKKGDWDVLYASKVDAMRGKRAGRLLEYDPATEETRVLARNLTFANGVSVDAEETYVVVSQTFAMRLSKYHLSGPRQGDMETVLDSHQLTGFTDGADCSWAATGPSAGKCYVAVPTPILTFMKFMQVVPHPLDQFLRGLLLMLPKWMAPKQVDYGCVVEVDMETGETRTLQDPDAIDQNFITGVTVHDNKLYLGSLHKNVVGVYDLS